MSSSFLALRRVATRSLTSYNRRVVFAARPAAAMTTTMSRLFSAEAAATAAATAEPVIPGIGKGKTSTGYVSAFFKRNHKHNGFDFS